MKPLALLSLLLCLSRFSGASASFSEWKSQRYAPADAAAQHHYLSEAEKEVIKYCNYARMDAPLFAKTFVRAYLEAFPSEAGQELYHELLQRQDSLAPLRPEPRLSRAAFRFASKAGSRGLEEHPLASASRFYRRLARFYPGAEQYAENFHTGSVSPAQIVVEMLIGQGDPHRAYRRNIFNPELEVVGVAIRPHKTACGTTFIELAQKATLPQRQKLQMPEKCPGKSNRKARMRRNQRQAQREHEAKTEDGSSPFGAIFRKEEE